MITRSETPAIMKAQATVINNSSIISIIASSNL